jgi:hypothetical protein
MNFSTNPDSQSGGLRERNVAMPTIESVDSVADSGQTTPADEEDVEREQKTFGRTPDGTSKSIHLLLRLCDLLSYS